MNTGQTIFIVDDSPTVVKFVSFSLRNSGFNVVSACDGMDAIEKLSVLPNKVDLLITDLNMPNLDGYSLITTLRQSEKHRQLPIIVLSSEDRIEERERGIAIGASAFILKPFKSSLLLNEVSKFLN
jgi:two-component system chemotaxis response regulator CheY